MKRVLIINNEKKAGNLGLFPNFLLPRLGDTASHILRLTGAAISLGAQAVVVHHSEINPTLVASLSPDLVIASGRTEAWNPADIVRDYAGEAEAVRASCIPWLGICAGHQIMATAFGGTVAAMSPLGEPEQGDIEVELLERCALAAGMGQTIRCLAWHGDEVKALPDGFKLVASGKLCRVQMMRHEKRPLYGVQFHPEFSCEESPDGGFLLSNFLKM